jgi:formylglycine-generating enzyme required for sulfatase activity
MAEPGPGAKLRDDLAKVEAAIGAQAALRGVLPEEQLAAALRPLEAHRDALRAQLAEAGAEPEASGGGGGSDRPGEGGAGKSLKGRARGQRKARPSSRARVTGSGASAQGDGTAAAGAGGLAVATGGSLTYVEGNLVQSTAMGESGDDLETSYLNWLFERLRGLSLAAIDPAVAAGKAADTRLELDAVYTGLMTVGQQESTERTGGAKGRGSKRAAGEVEPGVRPVSALTRLDRDRRLVLLGDPGSGKSTFVSFVALCLAGARLGRSDANLELLRAPLPDDRGGAARAAGVGEPGPQPWRHGPLLPVRVVLRDFAARGLPAAGARANASHLWSFVKAELECATLGGYAEALERHLRDQGGLVLLDGLDEVPEAEERRVQLCQAVEDFASAFSECRILVTSRTYAYRRQDWHLAGFAEAVLAPFGPAQVARFVERWYEHLAVIGRYDADDARGRATLLQQRIEASDRLSTLAERPLLLTLMASLHAWHGADLPERRERLYAAAVDLLLDLWERRQLRYQPDGRPVPAQPSLVEWLELRDKESLRVLLEKLAFDAHAAQPELVGTADVREDALVAGLMRIGAAETNPKLLVEYLRDRAGLLEPRGVAVYTFPHRTFQEYLAACYLTRGDYPGEVAELARREPERWREVALLAGAKAASGPTSAIWHLADRLCEREPGDPGATGEDAWGAHLAAQALIEVLGSAGLASPSVGNQRIVDRLRGWLRSLVCGSQLPALERAIAGDNLSRLGDPRPEVTTVDGMELCRVPPGRFWMGSGEDDKEGFEDEKPAGEVDLAYGYQLGRFPVTAAQFGEFEVAGGYVEERYWAEAAAAGVWTREGVRGDFDSEPRRGTGLGDSPWGLAGRPVVEITWYEALAFCRWLTDRWREAGRLPAGWTVSLPSEAEWEKAARGGLELPRTPGPRSAEEVFAEGEPADRPNESPRRLYPWGDAFDPERTNAGPTGIGSTSAVGCFPGGRSPYWVEELSGNCYEWTRSLWGDYPYPAAGRERAERETLESPDPRVLRGGSVFGVPGGVRCAYRDRRHPGFRLDLIGFRVVVLPPFFSEL